MRAPNCTIDCLNQRFESTISWILYIRTQKFMSKALLPPPRPFVCCARCGIIDGRLRSESSYESLPLLALNVSDGALRIFEYRAAMRSRTASALGCREAAV